MTRLLLSIVEGQEPRKTFRMGHFRRGLTKLLQSAVWQQASSVLPDDHPPEDKTHLFLVPSVEDISRTQFIKVTVAAVFLTLYQQHTLRMQNLPCWKTKQGSPIDPCSKAALCQDYRKLSHQLLEGIHLYLKA